MNSTRKVPKCVLLGWFHLVQKRPQKGKPRGYRLEMTIQGLAEVRRLVALRMSMSAICKHMSVSLSTFKDCRDRDPQLAAALLESQRGIDPDRPLTLAKRARASKKTLARAGRKSQGSGWRRAPDYDSLAAEDKQYRRTSDDATFQGDPIGKLLVFEVADCVQQVEMPHSRPGQKTTVITEAGCGVVRRMAELFYSEQLIAAQLGMSRQTFGDCKRRQPELKEALEVGKAGLAFKAASNLVQQSNAGNVIATIFLNKQFGMSDSPEAQDTVKPNVQIIMNAPMSNEEYKKMLAAGANPMQLPQSSEAEEQANRQLAEYQAIEAEGYERK